MQAAKYLAAWALFVFSHARKCLVLAFHSFLVSRTTQSADATRAVAAATGRMAVIDYRLGVIALAVEETSAAQQALDKCAVRSVDPRTPEAAVYNGVEELFGFACFAASRSRCLLRDRGEKGNRAGAVENTQPHNHQPCRENLLYVQRLVA